MAAGIDQGNVSNVVAKRQIEDRIAVARAYLRVGRISKLDKISRIYLRELVDVVHCDGCAIVRITGEKAEIFAAKGFSQAFPPSAFNAAIPAIRDAIAAKRTISNADIAGSPLAGYVPSTIKSLICTPIIVGGEISGMACVCSLRDNAFSVEDIDFIELMSAHISEFFREPSQRPDVNDMHTRGRLEGCFSRYEFDIDMAREIDSAKRYQDEVSLLRVYVGGVKKYDEPTGRAEADSLFERILDVLASNMRAYHKIYRYDQSEFIVVLEGTSKEKASLAARRLENALDEERFETHGKTHLDGKITVSIGVATYPTDADETERLIEAANPAPRVSKAGKRNRRLEVTTGTPD